MIRAIKGILDDVRDRVEGMPSLNSSTIEAVKKEIANVEDLILTEGAVIDLSRSAGVIRKLVIVPVSGEEAVILKEILAELKTLGVVANCFKQYFELSRR